MWRARALVWNGGGERQKMVPIGGLGASVSERREEVGWAGPAVGLFGPRRKREMGRDGLGWREKEREVFFFFLKLKHHLNKFI